jgi:2-octaprenyl-6-methoxyphenol hydroxylase
VSQSDVLIIGGGTVGCTLAQGLLAKTNLQVTLVDANAPGQSKTDYHPGFDARVIALSKRTEQELTAIGIDVSHLDTVPIQQILVTDQGALGQCLLTAHDYNVSSFGAVVALDTLGRSLRPQQTHPRLNYIAPASVEHISRSQDSVTAQLTDGRCITAKLLVMADGGRSDLYPKLGFTRHIEDYGQSAVIFNITTSQLHHGRAHERFTEHGPFALLPFNGEDKPQSKGRGYSAIWSLSHEQAREIMTLNDEQLIQRVHQVSGYRHGIITSVSARFQYPLSLQYVETPISHRTVVVGNGAQSLHPIAGQGFNLGLRDVMDLVSLLAQTDDPGAYALLKQYEKKRANDKRGTIKLTDGLVRLFSNSHAVLQAGRNIGLILLDILGPISSGFVRQTMGFGPAANASKQSKNTAKGG